MELLKPDNRPRHGRAPVAGDGNAGSRAGGLRTARLTLRYSGLRACGGSLWSLFFLLLQFGPFSGHLRGQAIKEYDLKAVFLYHLAQFVDWPPEAYPATDTPLVIGVLGQDPFGKALDEIIQNEVVKNRKLIVQRYRRLEEIKLCHVLFISPSENSRLAEVFAGLQGRAILTVGDTDGFARRGGMVRFLTDKGKIKLRINLDTARAANLTISSKLLRASDVIGARETPP